MADEELKLPPIERLQVVEIRPGDTIVATIPEHVTMERCAAVKQALSARFPANGVLVVSGDVSLSVQSPAPGQGEPK